MEAGRPGRLFDKSILYDFGPVCSLKNSLRECHACGLHEGVGVGCADCETVVYMNISPRSLLVLALAGSTSGYAQVSLTSNSVAYTQNFDAVLSSAPANGTVQSTPALPTGWAFVESGSNANTSYQIHNGGGTAGDTYLFGAAGSTERALGGIQSGSLIPTFGAFFTNNTGATVHSLEISYVGEMWRLGAADANDDRLDFQYSLNATSLTTGTWVDFNALDFTSLTQTTVGAKDGNSLRSTISSTISGLSISIGASFAIRWVDVNVTSSDDGLAVDNFSLTAIPEPGSYAAMIGVVAFGAVIAGRRRRLG